ASTGFTGWLDKDQVKDIPLAAGQYVYWTGSGQTPPWAFQVTPAGTIHYDAADATFLSGEGTATLTLRGFPITINASRLTGIGVLLDNGNYQGAPPQGWIRDQQIRLLPQPSYSFEQGPAMTNLTTYFDIGLDGYVHYPAAFDASNGGFMS